MSYNKVSKALCIKIGLNSRDVVPSSKASYGFPSMLEFLAGVVVL